MKCPICAQDVARMPDGSLAMHGKPDGGLCAGTNCFVYSTAAIVMCGQVIPVSNAWIDPDEAVEPGPGPRKGE